VSQVSPRVQMEIFFVKMNVVDRGDIFCQIELYCKYHLESANENILCEIECC
jgi:hypothetical protein